MQHNEKSKTGKLYLLAVSDIADRPYNWALLKPHRSDTELAMDVGRVGNTFPITVTRTVTQSIANLAAGPKPYTVVIGQRRLHAARASRRLHIPAKVEEYTTDHEAYVATLMDNLAGPIPLHPLDFAETAKALIYSGFPSAQLCLVLGIAPAILERRLELSKLSPKMREIFLAGLLTAETAGFFAGKSRTEQEGFAGIIGKRGKRITDQRGVNRLYKTLITETVTRKIGRGKEVKV